MLNFIAPFVLKDKVQITAIDCPPSLPTYFCGYLRERVVFCRIIKPACLLLWIPQGKACVLHDNQVSLPTSVDY
ncbi:hypothetical protein DPMN_180120 [Dreissena polymorpha]|uniref:Uncharacterized protein n=1 Tax=Dreissena polymorpha TaxID=45954 RepID=A0A9D4EID7_DREPO|nr:hypothetical protein DPMN_179895 [Dreissena polymorpha]KAH3778650.1 hypothetical protein DPMN_180120 [Dreissena polymorpha]